MPFTLFERSDLIEFGVATIIIGGGALYTGLLKSKLKRKIQDIPTSKISSAPIGDFIELKGDIFCPEEDIKQAPLEKVPCAFFTWEIQKYVKRGKNHTWVTIEKIFSDDYFLLEDGSGYYACIKTRDCEILDGNKSSTHGFSGHQLKSLPMGIRKSLDQYSKRLNPRVNENFLLSKKYRIIENAYRPGQHLYVLGSSHIPNKTLLKKHSIFDPKAQEVVSADHNERLKDKYNEAIKDEDLKEQYDVNNDGVLDHKERKQMFEDLQNELFKETKRTNFVSYLDKIKFVMEKAEGKEKIFSLNKVMISTKGEELFLGKLKWLVPLLLGGGVLMTTAGLVAFGAYFLNG